MITLFWLIVVAVMLVIEIFTMGLTTIWFSIGAVVAAVISCLGGPLWLQIVLFCIVSVAIMLLVRPFALRVVNQSRTRTNIDEVVGEDAVVIEKIDNHLEQGKVRYRGVEWMARSRDNEVYDVDTLVTVSSVSGVKLIVTKMDCRMEEK